MTKLIIDTKQLNKDMKNIIAYSEGFLEGVQKGKKRFFGNVGKMLIESAKQFIDSNARINPSMLHHVYEWQKTGSPNARLFDINYFVNDYGLSFNYTFSQSSTIKNGSSQPFYDKARIMEQGIPVTIAPVRSDVLAFDYNGEEVFTRSEVTVNNPGGDLVKGSFEKIYSEFFTKYFSQAFLKTSGIIDYLENPVLYKTNFSKGKDRGRQFGLQVGYSWIGNAGIVNG
jgi:hypothetical protein